MQQVVNYHRNPLFPLLGVCFSFAWVQSLTAGVTGISHPETLWWFSFHFREVASRQLLLGNLLLKHCPQVSGLWKKIQVSFLGWFRNTDVQLMIANFNCLKNKPGPFFLQGQQMKTSIPSKCYYLTLHLWWLFTHSVYTAYLYPCSLSRGLHWRYFWESSADVVTAFLLNCGALVCVQIMCYSLRGVLCLRK